MPSINNREILKFLSKEVSHLTELPYRKVKITDHFYTDLEMDSLGMVDLLVSLVLAYNLTGTQKDFRRELKRVKRAKDVVDYVASHRDF